MAPLESSTYPSRIGAHTQSVWNITCQQTTSLTLGGKKRSILLSTCGAATYKLIRNLTSPEPPVSKTYKEIVDLVQTHYQPKPSVMIERLKFNSRIRQTGESVSTFMTELRQSSKYCDFGESLNDMLRDRLVCGINDSRIQRRLLSELNLTFQKAFDLALAMEIADKDTQDMQKATRFQPSDVHVLQPKSFLKKVRFQSQAEVPLQRDLIAIGVELLIQKKTVGLRK